jgi:hypothetical protein
MVDCKVVYDKKNNKDLAQLIKDTSILRILPTTTHQVTIDKWLAPYDDPPSYHP